MVAGGEHLCGTLFRVTASGEFTLLHAFAGSDGCSPESELVQGTDGTLYGTTLAGGAKGQGAAFGMAPQGVITMQHSFTHAEGFQPWGLVEGVDGDFYGVADGAARTEPGRCSRWQPTAA
jgi:uncharacterized repeat protein (TIGR03803 family)